MQVYVLVLVLFSGVLLGLIFLREVSIRRAKLSEANQYDVIVGASLNFVLSVCTNTFLNVKH